MTAVVGRVRDVLALTPMQEGLHALDSLSATGSGGVYTVQLAVRVTGRIDPAELRRAADTVLDRHPQLGGRFVTGDLPRPVHVLFTDDRTDIRHLHAADAEERRRLAGLERDAPIDLAAGPPLRLALIDVPGEGSTLVLTAHHIVLDGWSAAVYFRELFTLLAGVPADALPPAPSTRGHLAWLQGRDGDAAREYWRRRFADDPAAPALGRSAGVGGGVAGGTVGTPVVATRTLPPALESRLSAWCRAEGVTAATAFHVAVAALVGALSDRRDVTVGVTSSGRSPDVPGSADMIGALITTVPVRIVLDPTGRPGALARRVRRDTAADLDNGHIGLRAITRAAGLTTPFEALVVYNNAPPPPVRQDMGPLTVVATEAAGLTHVPLVVSPRMIDGKTVVDVELREELLPLGGVDLVADRVVAILDELCEAPTVAGLTGRVRADPDPAAPPRAAAVAPDAPTAIALFDRAVDRAPRAVALRHRGPDGAQTLTYGELDLRVDAVARALRDSGVGVGTGDGVAIVTDRSVETIVALLGTLRAGGRAVHLAPDLPDGRRDHIVRVGGVTAAVCAGPYRHLVPRDLPVVDPASETVPGGDRDGAARDRPRLRALLRPADAAYTVFTSGSTGEPMGVTGTHDGLAALHAFHEESVLAPARRRLGRRPVVGHGWSFGFDASWQPLMALFSGDTVELLDTAVMADPDALAAAIADRGIDVIEMSPTLYRHLARHDDHVAAAVGGVIAGLTVLGLGGEAIDPETWRRLRARPDGPRAMNFYGPTETTVDAFAADLADSAEPSIGRALPGMRALVLDATLRPVPLGGVGVLHLGGPQVARGYEKNPGLTARRFVPDPWLPGERLYVTGDVVRLRPDGDVVFLGRDDRQVKIRGHRIEVGEVEAALAAIAGIADAAVVTFERAAGTALRAFVVPSADAAPPGPDPARVRRALLDALPGYMIPADITVIAEVPVTSNGKRDTTALAAVPFAPRRGDAATGIEEELCAVISATLGGAAADALSPEDDLTTFGLDSIAIVAVTAALRRAGHAVGVAEVAAAGTVADLAALLDPDIPESPGLSPHLTDDPDPIPGATS